MLNIAVVGLGAWGLRHVQSASASGRFKVVKGVDKAQVKVDFPVTDSLQEVLDDPDIHAVSIATPHTLHADQIRQAALAGKHILTEKPFAMSHAEALANVAITRAQNVVLALGHDHRFYPAVAALRALIAKDAFGQVTTVQSVLSHDFTKKALEKLNREAAERGENGDTGSWWRLNLAEAPVGPMVHLGIHHLDLFIHLFGEIEWVLASTPARTIETPFPDTMLVTLGFTSGKIGTINSSLASPLNSRLLISGSEGWAEAVGPDDIGSYTKSSLSMVKRRLNGTDPETEHFPLIDSVAANFVAFADAIEGVAPYPVPAADMIHNAAVLEAIVQSSRSGTIERVQS
ncbi:Gfo/Idh/MocA family protein [Pseudorhodobacter sp. W20_MBD10_FR17]|uniref:Gfo/Idh/MocA family protein n=1 Tax=Pseudorhodobacter sp. W20_MBD10_FR17 TaxID=3240266 RepID=UPI003F9589B0